MKITITNGRSKTCNVYQRKSVSLDISDEPSSTNLTCEPKTGV